MYFLDARRGRSRRANFRVAVLQQGRDSAAVTPAQGDDLHAAPVRGRYPPEDVFRVSAGRDGEQDITLPAKGMDLPGEAAAVEDARKLAGDLKNGEKMPGWNWGGWFVSVLDAHGRKIDEVPIADVM